MCIFKSCDISLENTPTSNTVSLALFLYLCSDLLSCACLLNEREREREREKSTICNNLIAKKKRVWAHFRGWVYFRGDNSKAAVLSSLFTIIVIQWRLIMHADFAE